MTEEEFAKVVQILVTPEQPQIPHPKGGLDGKQGFWVHTAGMAAFERPELEMRDVPGLFVREASRILNRWGLYSLETEIKADQLLMEEGSLDCVLTAVESTDDWYTAREMKALELKTAAILYQCSSNMEDNPTVH